MTAPLRDIKVLDFSTLLPGPMATLFLAEAGAEVIKVERPGRGEEMRSYLPKWGADSANFNLLNRGKKSIAVDLFSGMTNLKNLQLQSTELTALPASLFDTNTKLETLMLSNNAKLSAIDPLMFEKNVALVSLNMGGNVLSSISANQFEKNVLLESKLLFL